MDLVLSCCVVKDLLNFSQFMEFWAGKGCSREECLPVGGATIPSFYLFIYLFILSTYRYSCSLICMGKVWLISTRYDWFVDLFILIWVCCKHTFIFSICLRMPVTVQIQRLAEW